MLGSHGERYAVRVRNNTSSRVEAVVSVDGRDAISGRVADFARERGYVIPAHGSVRIDGFRRNMESVAAFRFTEPGNSYSARRGTPQNVGIIGAAFFPEMRRRPVAVAEPRSAGRTERESRKSQRRRPAPAKSKSSKKRRTDDTAESSPRGDRKNNIGTEYGETRMSRVVGVAFQRASRTRPARVVTVRYDDAEGLRARGIRIRPMHRQPVVRRDEPMAFPKRRFAPPPR